MFELIIVIIIITVVMKSKKKNQKTASKPSVVRTQPTPVPGRPQQSRPQQRPVQGMAQRNVSQSKPVQKNPVKQEEMSTMEMLEAKALEDDREEMLEKQRQLMENKKHYGSLHYAEKYVIGDPVPKGKRMICCSYCNAENLIPAYSVSKDYNCYFCREEL